MSAENAEIVKRMMDTYRSGDLEAQLAVLDPDVEFVEWPTGPDQKTDREPALEAAGLTPDHQEERA